jgi:hypothetical protein
MPERMFFKTCTHKSDFAKSASVEAKVSKLTLPFFAPSPWQS